MEIPQEDTSNVQIPKDNTLDMETEKSGSKLKIIVTSLFALILIVAAVFGFQYYLSTIQIDEFDEESIPILDSLDVLDYDKAISLSEDLYAKRGSEDLNSSFLLAKSYLLKGSNFFKEKEYSDKALAVLEEVKAFDPDFDSSEIHRLEGYAYEITEQYEKAISSYEKAIELDPEFALAYSQLGHVYDLMGDKEKAIGLYNKALELDSELEYARLNIGKIYYQDGSYDLAQEFLKGLMVEGVDNATASRALVMLGLITMSEDREEDYFSAAKYFEEALKYDPNYAFGWSSLAYAYFGQLDGLTEETTPEGQVDLIIQTADKALALNPKLSDALITKANVEQYVNDDCVAANNIYSRVLNDIVDVDITLGAVEKTQTKDYLKLIIGICNEQINED